MKLILSKFTLILIQEATSLHFSKIDSVYLNIHSLVIHLACKTLNATRAQWAWEVPPSATARKPQLPSAGLLLPVLLGIWSATQDLPSFRTRGIGTSWPNWSLRILKTSDYLPNGCESAASCAYCVAQGGCCGYARACSGRRFLAGLSFFSVRLCSCPQASSGLSCSAPWSAPLRLPPGPPRYRSGCACSACRLRIACPCGRSAGKFACPRACPCPCACPGTARSRGKR